jgi:hypothetical protein
MLEQRRIAREIGAAFAVLAIYLLVLLAPLHQAAGLQRDLAKLGYDTVGALSVCVAIAEDDDTSAAVKCPAAGIGKAEFTGPVPVQTLVPPAVSTAAAYAAPSAALTAPLPEHVGQSRAPPALTA